MAAVTHAPPVAPRRLVGVPSGPCATVRPSPRRVPAATYRRRRAAALAALAGAVVAAALAVHVVFAPLGSPPPAPADQAAVSGPVYVVQPGDTFWGIARALRPDEDPRPLVARMVAAHGSPALAAGERLRLPGGG